MIYHISGKLDAVLEDAIIVDVSGIGYHVFVPESILNTLPEKGSEIKVFTYHHIREDAQSLFGFLSEEDRSLFILLTSVSGVGPKVGVKILSYFKVSELVNAIIQENLATLTSVSGVGKKMAERLVLELKDKLPKIYSSHKIVSDTGASSKPIIKAEDDLFQAMKTLGYSQDEIKRSYMKAAIDLKEEMTLEDSLKVLLKHL